MVNAVGREFSSIDYGDARFGVGSTGVGAKKMYSDRETSPRRKLRYNRLVTCEVASDHVSESGDLVDVIMPCVSVKPSTRDHGYTFEAGNLVTAAGLWTEGAEEVCWVSVSTIYDMLIEILKYNGMLTLLTLKSRLGCYWVKSSLLYEFGSGWHIRLIRCIKSRPQSCSWPIVRLRSIWLLISSLRPSHCQFCISCL
jgi:hypothetical protein